MEANMPVMPTGYGYGGGYGDDNFFKYLILLGLLNGGGGLFGNNRQAGITEAIALEGNWNTTMSKLDGITQGIANAGYANLEGQNRIENAISSGLCNLGYQNSQGFAGINNAITNSRWDISRELMGIASQMADCCCSTQRNIDSLRYDMSKGFCDVITAGNVNTRDLMENQNNNTQRIVDIMNNNTIQALRDENQALKLSASQQAQTANITANIEAYVNNAIQNSTKTIIEHIPFILRNNGNCGCNY